MWNDDFEPPVPEKTAADLLDACAETARRTQHNSNQLLRAMAIVEARRIADGIERIAAFYEEERRRSV